MTVKVGNLQMEAAWGRSMGSAWCSKRPHGPASDFYNCFGSKTKKAIPNENLLELSQSQRVKAPKLIKITQDTGKPANRRISHGGPAMKPTTCRSLVAPSHNWRVPSCLASPHVGLMMMSIETAVGILGYVLF